MPTYPSIYRAKAVRYSGKTLTTYVPQVFGDQSIEVANIIGEPTGMGWVMFEAGNPAFPVWLSEDLSGGGGGSDFDPAVLAPLDEVWIGPGDPGMEYELWYDTDAPNPGGGGGGGGPSGPVSYVYNQSVVSANWTVTHNLGWYPNVTVIDSAGSTVEGDITQVSVNQLTIHFTGSFTGVAYLS